VSRPASLERRVATAAGEVLAREKAVSAIDDLLMSGVPRAEARDQIRPAIDRLLATWA